MSPWWRQTFLAALALFAPSGAAAAPDAASAAGATAAASEAAAPAAAAEKDPPRSGGGAAYEVLVVGRPWEERWVEQLFSAVPAALVSPPPWRHRAANHLELADFAAGRPGAASAGRPLMLVTNLVGDPAVRVRPEKGSASRRGP